MQWFAFRTRPAWSLITSTRAFPCGDDGAGSRESARERNPRVRPETASIGGIYAHYYANAYPGEVSAIIGIDPTQATASTLEVGTPSRTEGVLAALGVYTLGDLAGT